MINIEKLNAYQQNFILSALENSQENDNSSTVYSVEPKQLNIRYGVYQEDMADFMKDLMKAKIETTDGKQFSFFQEIQFENMMLQFCITDEALAHKDEIYRVLAENNKEQDLLEIVKGYYETFGDDYEDCWRTGNYDDQYCPLCPHSSECSGYEDRD